MSAQPQTLERIEGVRRLKWGEWRDCTYGGAVTVVMNTMGVEVTYEDVMGMSGACYRICMQDNWDPSAGMPQCGYDVETPLYRALGFERYRIRDEDERRQKVLEDEGQFTKFPAGTNGYHLDLLRDARRCAYVYLGQGLELLSGSNRGGLEKAVGLFRGMFDKLMTITPYEGTESSFNGRVEEWGMSKRRELAALLREVCAMEREVEGEFRKILSDWNPHTA